MLKTIYFAGNHGQPCQARYAILSRSDDSLIAKVDVLVVQSDKWDSGTSLWNSDEGRASIMNRILSHDLEGVRLEFIDFYFALDIGSRLDALRIPIELDVDDYVSRGNPHDLLAPDDESIGETLYRITGKPKRYAVRYSSVHVVGGCAKVSSPFDKREHVDPAKLASMMKAAGF